MYWYLLKTILSSVLGSSFYQWFKNTKVGVWWQDKLDDFMEYVSVKYDINIAKRELNWLSQYPALAARIQSLESVAHPKCGLEEFDGFHKLDQRIKKLEKRIKKLEE
jgi:hypothetical protein|tara:strand:+ start:896 stop:1216 length:321 start_codon:yes stop_codon:yes gene_type:complete